MKRFLCAGEGYVLVIPRFFKIFYYTIITFLIIVLTNTLSIGQSINESPKDYYQIPPGGVVIGDKLPEWFWDLSLDYVIHPYNIKSVKLQNFRDQLLVIDFWATWCKPCVESVDKWQILQKEFRNEVAVLALYAFDDPSKAKPFVEKRGWTVPVVKGNADSLINRLFFTKYRQGQVWIKDDRLIAIPLSKSVTKENIIKVILNLPHEIEMNDNLTYFDRRYKMLKGGQND